MLTRIDLEHFKCFHLLRLPLEKLTLLSGPNASGKSSVLQALVLLHQTILEQEWSTRLLLNGNEISLGTVTDVVDKITGRHSFGIGLVDDKTEVMWTFESDDRKDMSVAITSLNINGDETDHPNRLRHLLPEKTTKTQNSLTTRLKRLTYITAERAGPREVYDLKDPSATQLVGPRGDSAVSLLHIGRDETVIENLLVSGNPPTRLRQVEARMRQFFPGCALELQQIPHANAVTLGLRNSAETDYHRPVHVGFGLTQVLPIIVAALSAEKGDILVIENPEVHLHPAGQAGMGEFLAEVAAAGIQVVVETHSDHVLNGVRKSVKKSKLSNESVFLHFFRSREDGKEHVTTPTLDKFGNIDYWPDGFFDQFDKDMNYFAGWSDDDGLSGK